jgi:hypothetical protein
MSIRYNNTTFPQKPRYFKFEYRRAAFALN